LLQLKEGKRWKISVGKTLYYIVEVQWIFQLSRFLVIGICIFPSLKKLDCSVLTQMQHFNEK
jgi:hypothetical protein